MERVAGRMRRSYMFCVVLAAAAVAAVAGQVGAVQSVSRQTTATVGAVDRSAAVTSVERGFGRRECAGCVATFAELQSALSGSLPAGETVITLCRSTKTTPIVLTEDLLIEGEDANVSINCCGSPEFRGGAADGRPGITPRRSVRFGAVKRRGFKCEITRTGTTESILYDVSSSPSTGSPSVTFSSIEFREGNGEPVASNSPIFAGTGTGSIVFFNRYDRISEHCARNERLKKDTCIEKDFRVSIQSDRVSTFKYNQTHTHKYIQTYTHTNKQTNKKSAISSTLILPLPPTRSLRSAQS